MFFGVVAAQQRAANSGGLPTVIGQAYGGGFYAGDISYGGKNYKIIIAPLSAEPVSTLAWKTSNTSTTGTTSTTDGLSNSNAMNNTSHPAARHCRTYTGSGFTDWYLPSKDELNLFWLNLPPGEASTPAAFQTGGAQALKVDSYYWASTQSDASNAWIQRFNVLAQFAFTKTTAYYVRPIRRIEF